ncbi:MAG: FHA domain-containing protein, partial [Candidatus Promineifilaceae bacterium]
MFEEVVHQVQISGPQVNQTYLIPPGRTTIGRQAGSDLVLAHPLVSRHHAEFDCQGDVCRLIDLGSTHGTQVNGQTLAANQPLGLNSGDEIVIGAFHLAYEKVGVGGVEPTSEPTKVEEEVVTAVSPSSEPAAQPTPPAPQPPPAPPPAQEWVSASTVPL